MLGCTLTLGAAGDRLNFRTVASVRMTEAERAMLAYVALTALSPDASARIAAMAFEAAGEPSPAFLGGMADARDWASWATLAELKAHALPSGRRS